MTLAITLVLSALAAIGIVWFLRERARRTVHAVPAGHQPDILVPHEAPFELYHNALSLCSMKARVCMAELHVPYKSHHIDLIETGCYENIRPVLLDVNPGGTVPVLIHEGHPIYESHEQIRYAAAHVPEGTPALVPGDSALRAEMEDWVDKASIIGDPIGRSHVSIGNAIPVLTMPIFATMVERIPIHLILEGLLFHFDRRRPMLFLTLKLAGIHRLPRLKPLARAIALAREHAEVHFDELEAQLEKTGGPWILGDQFTLADVGFVSVFERLIQVDALDVFVGGDLRPHCTAYWAALRARPSYNEAILEQGHPLITYGTDRIKEAKTRDPALRALLEGPAH
jgi:glutathione S-transferase